MAITKGAKKAHRVSLRKKVFNDRRKNAMKLAVKRLRTLISDKKKDEAAAKLPEAFKALDKAAKRGVIKKNNASRKKSRLAKAVSKISE